MRRTNNMEYVHSAESDILTEYILTHDMTAFNKIAARLSPCVFDRIITAFFFVITDTVYFTLNGECAETGEMYTASDIYTAAYNILAEYL